MESENCNKLLKNWRSVSSTHNFQDLLNDELNKPLKFTKQSRILGWALLFFGLSIFILFSLFLNTELKSAFKRPNIVDSFPGLNYYLHVFPMLFVVIATFSCLSWFTLKLFKHA